jgi:hypothetical protein
MSAAEFWQAVGAKYPDFATVARRDKARRTAFLNRREDFERYAREQVDQLRLTDDRVVPIAAGTQWAAERREESIAAHIAFRSDGEYLHIGPGGRRYSPPRAEVHIGVLTPSMPITVFELSRDYPLAEILQSIPVDTDPPAVCDLPASVDIVGGGSSLCTGDADGYAIDYGSPWIIVYRCCVMCARKLFEDNWRRGDMAADSACYVSRQK